MRRYAVMGATLALGSLLCGCHTLMKTAGVCDCDPPPVASLLKEPALPPHLCNSPIPVGVISSISKQSSGVASNNSAILGGEGKPSTPPQLPLTPISPPNGVGGAATNPPGHIGS